MDDGKVKNVGVVAVILCGCICMYGKLVRICICFCVLFVPGTKRLFLRTPGQ